MFGRPWWNKGNLIAEQWSNVYIVSTKSSLQLQSHPGHYTQIQDNILNTTCLIKNKSQKFHSDNILKLHELSHKLIS